MTITILDTRTANYAIPLPSTANRVVDDIGRLTSALTSIDLILAQKLDISLSGTINGFATLDANGRLVSTQTPAFNGDITSSAGSTTLTLSNTGVTAGSYNVVTVDAKGRVTSALNNRGIASGVASLDSTGKMPASQLPEFTGGAVISAGGTAVLSLSTTGVSAGTYTTVTVDVFGRVTNGSTQNNALPSQTDNTGKFLTTDGTTASWQTITATAGGGGLAPTAIITSAYTAAANDLIRCDTTTALVSITLPLNPPDGSIIGIVDVNRTFSYHNVIIYPTVDKTIESDATSYVLDIDGTYVEFIYNSINHNWRLLDTPFDLSVVPVWNQNTTGTAAGLSSTLAVGSGGTGQATLTANNVLLGNGTNGIQSVSPGNVGNVLSSNGSTWISAAAPISLPSQTGNSGKYLTTDGTTAAWATQVALPPQTGSAGKFLTTDGTTASWVNQAGGLAVVTRSGPIVTVPHFSGQLSVTTRSSTIIQVSLT